MEQVADMRTTYPRDDDGDALRRLAEDGSDMSRPMWIDFMLAVPFASEGMAIGTEAAKLGYAASVEQDEASNKWMCYCRREMVATYAAIVAAQLQLDAIARRIRGWLGLIPKRNRVATREYFHEPSKNI
jgi:hypothetical protein